MSGSEARRRGFGRALEVGREGISIEAERQGQEASSPAARAAWWCGRGRAIEVGASLEVMMCRSGMRRPAMGNEADAAHETAAIRAEGKRLAGVFVCLWLAGGGGLADRLGLKQAAQAREALASVALGEKAVVPDAVKAVGQDVEQETPDELVRGEAHDAGAPAATIVLVGERDFIVADDYEPRIGDGGSMRVAGEIGEHARGSAEWRLGVDDEGALAQSVHAFGERGGLGERD